MQHSHSKISSRLREKHLYPTSTIRIKQENRDKDNIISSDEPNEETYD